VEIPVPICPSCREVLPSIYRARAFSARRRSSFVMCSIAVRMARVSRAPRISVISRISSCESVETTPHGARS
jgi:hypothetical protein